MRCSRFAQIQRPYNSYVLPRADGTFWVYFMPAQTDAAALPHGADIRYLVAADGSRSTSTRCTALCSTCDGSITWRVGERHSHR